MKKRIIYQSGAATIMFTMFIVVLISLLSIGFATLVRNDQRASTDKTLSSQAQYLAEGAINNVAQKIKANPSAFTTDNDSCNNTGAEGSLKPAELNSNGNQITCLTWTVQPKQLVYTNLGTVPKVSPIEPDSGAIEKLKVSWTPSDIESADANIPTDDADFSKGMGANDPPSIKLALSNSDMSKNSVVYLLPRNSDSEVHAQIDNGYSGNIGTANCNKNVLDGNKMTCVATVWLNGANAIGVINNTNKAYMSVNTINGRANLTIVALNGVDPAKLKGAQAQIQATVRSNDVTKKLSATIPLQKTTWHPSYAAISDTLCKNYRADGEQDKSGPANPGKSVDVNQSECQ